MPATSNQESFVITKELQGLRLDKALATHPQIRTRSRAAKLIQALRVKKDSKSVKPSLIVELGETYLLDIPVETTTELIPYKIKLDVVYEDDDIIVVNKPSGLVVHPSHGHDNDTLVNALIHHCSQLLYGVR